eukprot:10731043-Prorocentrum_lima.AAC.1
MASYDNTEEILTLLKAMWGLEDAPRAFGMGRSRSLKEIRYHLGVTDPQIWRKFSQTAGYARKSLRLPPGH